jgi:hypothetical protein
VRHVMGFKYMFVYWFVVDVIVEVGILVCFM